MTLLDREEAYYAPYIGHPVRRLTYHSHNNPSGALASGGLGKLSLQQEEAYNACSDRFKRKNPIMVCFAPKANLRNSLVRLPEPAWGPQCGRNPDESGDEASNCFYSVQDPWRHIWQ